MAIYDFFLSRNNAASTPANYVGHTGRLFYESTTGEIKISDGVTAGGLQIPIALASETQFGGVKLGPGVVLNGLNQIIIDETDLDFNFGDFESTVQTLDGEETAVLTSTSAGEPIIISTGGASHISIVGEFHVHKWDTDLNTTSISEPIFRVAQNGKVRILAPETDGLAGAVEITGYSTGEFHPPNQTGVILHSTGVDGLISRQYVDANNNYPVFVGRRYNGTVNALTPVLNGETIFRIAGQGSTGTNFETFGVAGISWLATEDQSTSNQGGKIIINVTGNGNVASAATSINVAEFTENGIIAALGVTGDLTGNAGTVTNGVYTTGSYANPTWITSLAGSKVTNAVLTTGSYANPTWITSLAGTKVTGNISGNAGTVTNGVYTTDTGTVINTMLSNSSITINGTSIALGAAGTVTAAAGTLTGTTLNSTVVNSSLTSVGTLTDLTVTNPIVGNGSQLTNLPKPTVLTALSSGPSVFAENAGTLSTITNMTLSPPAGTYLASFSSEYISTLTGSVTATAAADLATLYTELQNLTPTVTNHAAAFGGGETLGPGVYTVPAAWSIAGTLTLNGGPTDLFVFRGAGAFTTSNSATIVLTGGATSNNVFWVSQGAISTGTNTVLKGSFIANQAANNPGAGLNLEGRVLTINGAISINTATITEPTGTINSSLTLGTINLFSVFAAIGAISSVGTSSNIALSIGSNSAAVTGFAAPNVVGGTIYSSTDQLSVIQYGIYIDNVLIPNSFRTQSQTSLVSGWPMSIQTIATVTAGQVVSVKTIVPTGGFTIGPAMALVLIPTAT